jgi:proline iminopeptidase
MKEEAVMSKWGRELIKTSRGEFEVFVKGAGKPICVAHHYSEFNETGDYFAESFTKNNKVFLVNLKEAGNSDKINHAHELSMMDAVLDLEEIRKLIGYTSWTFAGHSTGGMIGVLYGIHFSSSLQSLIIVGSAARKYFASSAECIYHQEHPKFNRMQQLIELLKQENLSHDERKEYSEERTKLSLFYPDKYEEYFSLDIHKKMCAPRMNFFSREVLIFDVTRELSKISTQTLIIGGKHDVQCPISFSVEMNDLIPNSLLYICKESNHYPFLEEQSLYDQIISKFLADAEVY